MNRTVAILTMSSKNGGYCVAGVDIENGKWIRLVSDNNFNHGALDSRSVTYFSGAKCKPLDVVEVPLIAAKPLKYQPENYLMNTRERLRKQYTIQLKDLLKIHPPENHSFLFGDQYVYILKDTMEILGHSLILVHVTDLTIIHLRATSTKADFKYNGTKYNQISVTDPDYYGVENYWHTDDAILVMSLPDSPFKDKYYYKFVAKIFPI